MKTQHMVRNIGFGAILAVTLGACIEYYPFLGDNMIVREIQYCTVVICVVIAKCAVAVKNMAQGDEAQENGS